MIYRISKIYLFICMCIIYTVCIFKFLYSSLKNKTKPNTLGQMTDCRTAAANTQDVPTAFYIDRKIRKCSQKQTNVTMETFQKDTGAN